MRVVTHDALDLLDGRHARADLLAGLVPERAAGAEGGLPQLVHGRFAGNEPAERLVRFHHLKEADPAPVAGTPALGTAGAAPERPLVRGEPQVLQRLAGRLVGGGAL